jgi:hypothetical protein
MQVESSKMVCINTPHKFPNSTHEMAGWGLIYSLPNSKEVLNSCCSCAEPGGPTTHRGSPTVRRANGQLALQRSPTAPSGPTAHLGGPTVRRANSQLAFQRPLAAPGCPTAHLGGRTARRVNSRPSSSCFSIFGVTFSPELQF